MSSPKGEPPLIFYKSIKKVTKNHLYLKLDISHKLTYHTDINKNRKDKTMYEKYKDTIKATNIARRNAIKVLIANHRQEFDEIYLVEATKKGLNPTKIKAQVERTKSAVEVQNDN